MSRKKEIEELLLNHNRFLHVLKKQHALFGDIHAPPYILMGIESTEVAISELKEELKELSTSGFDQDNRRKSSVSGNGKEIHSSNLGKALEALEEVLPEGDPVLQELVCSLRNFAVCHELINEWKELHNLLQELHSTLDEFSMEVERLYERSTEVGVKELRRRWRPSQRKIRILAEFAKKIEHIWREPYSEANGKLQGPPWMVEIIERKWDLEEMLKENCEIDQLYELTTDFSDVCYSHLYRTDKNLHNEAEKLYKLSHSVFTKLKQ